MPQTPLSPAQALPQITAILAQGRPCRLVVTGNSMQPFLRHGRDAVILAPLRGEIRRGDILLYLRAPGYPVLHRVHRALEDGTLLMCGDAQRVLEPIRPEQVLARATHIDRGGTLLDCGSPAQRRKAALWQALYPARRYILAALRRCGRLK